MSHIGVKVFYNNIKFIIRIFHSKQIKKHFDLFMLKFKLVLIIRFKLFLKALNITIYIYLYICCIIMYFVNNLLFIYLCLYEFNEEILIKILYLSTFLLQYNLHFKKDAFKV